VTQTRTSDIDTHTVRVGNGTAIRVVGMHEQTTLSVQVAPSLSLQDTIAEGSNCEDHDGALSSAERALKRQRVQDKTEGSKYINTRFLLPTSSVVERLFSLAKRVFSPHRRRLSTKTLDALLFLNQNRQLWNLSTVASVVNGRDDAESDEEQDEGQGEGGKEEQDWYSAVIYIYMLNLLIHFSALFIVLCH
jgi:hypothetical protein